MSSCRIITVAFAAAMTTLAMAQLNVDSLKRIWADTTFPPRLRVATLAAALDLDSAFTPERAARMASGTSDTTDTRYERAQALALLAKGSIHLRWGRYREAVTVYEKGLARCGNIGYAAGIGAAHEGLARAYGGIGAFDRVVEHAHVIIGISQALRDTDGSVVGTNWLAYAATLQGNDPLAIHYYKAILDLVRGHDVAKEFDVVTRIAEAYQQLGDGENCRLWLDSADRLIRLRGAVDKERMVGWMHGESLLDQGHCLEALREFERTDSAIAAGNNNPAGRSWMRSCMAKAFNCDKDYKRGLRSAQEGLAIAEEHHLLKEQVDNLFPLATALESLGNSTEALFYFKRYHALSDSMMNSRSAVALADLALTSSFEKQQFADSLVNVQQQAVAATALQKERSRRNLLLAAGLVAVVFGSISYRQRRRTQKALRRSDELLLNILPEEVADELKAKGLADAKHYDSVTILFTDFKGFTAMSEQVSPKQLVHDLHECFSAFDRITGKYGIEKIKTIGDAYMAAGGLPTSNTTHATDVIKAAFEMRDFIAEGKARKVTDGLPYFEIRIGIHTGPVVAGIVGVKKFSYDIWGDTVNTASRMESSGEVGQVNISEATYELVRNEAGLTFTSRGKVQAKGKGEMEMYFVESA